MEASPEKVTLNPMLCPKMPCKCGRMARVHPETGKAFKHRPGSAHPNVGKNRGKRKGSWCPEGV